jgi:hypothetical protein
MKTVKLCAVISFQVYCVYEKVIVFTNLKKLLLNFNVDIAILLHSSIVPCSINTSGIQYFYDGKIIIAGCKLRTALPKPPEVTRPPAL